MLSSPSSRTPACFLQAGVCLPSQDIMLLLTAVVRRTQGCPTRPYLPPATLVRRTKGSLRWPCLPPGQ